MRAWLCLKDQTGIHPLTGLVLEGDGDGFGGRFPGVNAIWEPKNYWLLALAMNWRKLSVQREIVFSGPINLKNQGPCELSSTAPSN